jgi:hypothetical protein
VYGAQAVVVGGEGAVVLAGVAGTSLGGVGLFMAVDAPGGRVGEAAVASEEAGGAAALAALSLDGGRRVRRGHLFQGLRRERGPRKAGPGSVPGPAVNRGGRW